MFVPTGNQLFWVPTGQHPALVNAEGRDMLAEPGEDGLQPIVYNFNQDENDGDNLETWDETVRKGVFDDDFSGVNLMNGKPWTEDYKKDHNNLLKPMASYQKAKIVFDDLKKHQVMLLTMGTGAGKTVMMPKIIMHYYAYKKKIVCTIPRKGITESAAEFAARTMDVNVGEEVGYRHGGNKTMATPDTKLLYTTDGTVKAKMTNTDPDLMEYQAIIIDEAHERNVNIDVMLLLLRDLCTRRPDFKVIIMSATVDVSVFKNYFEEKGLTFIHTHVEPDDTGRKYHVDKIWLDYPIGKKDYPEYLFQQVDKLLRHTEEGDIIAFVHTLTPAYKTILRLEENRQHYKGNPCFVPFGGGISEEDNLLARGKVDNDPYYVTKGFTRCVIIGTNALESSFTSPGKIIYVVESGLAKKTWYDPVKFATIVELTYITQDSIKQRQGRTGRVCNGQAYMLYTKETYDEQPEFAPPTIINSDITNDILGIMNLPMNRELSKTLSFMSEMITPPTIESIESGVKLLYNYSMINSKGEMSDLGITANSLGKLGPELTRMLLAGYYYGCLEEMVMLSSMMISSQGKDLSAFIRKPHFKAEEEERIKYKKKIQKFGHPRGDHFVLINILKSYLMIHPDDRMKWCIDLDFRPDAFETIYKDFISIKESLQELDFPQMFSHYPPPSKPDKPPRDLLEYLALQNKEDVGRYMEHNQTGMLWGNELEKPPRFDFVYGGARKGNKKKTQKQKPKNPKKKSNTRQQRTDQLREELENRLKKLELQIFEGQDDSPKSSRTRPPQSIKIIFENSNTKPSKDKNQKSSRIMYDISSESLLKTTSTNRKNSVRSIYKEKDTDYTSDLDLWSIKNDLAKPKIKDSITSSNLKKLISKIRNEYHGDRLSKIKMDLDMKRMIMMTPQEYSKFQYQNSEDNKQKNKRSSDRFIIDDEDNPISIKYYDHDKAERRADLNYKPKTKEDLLEEIEFNQELLSLSRLRINDPRKKKTQKCQGKPHKKNKQSKRNNKNKNQKGGFINKGKPKPEIDFELLEKEKIKFGKFLDQISLRTESGILPEFKIFEDPEENIMACIFYGFYMKLGVNYYQNRYLVKLPKFDAKFENSIIEENRNATSLIIYQNLTINEGKANMGIVSNLSPRIINAFI